MAQSFPLRLRMFSRQLWPILCLVFVAVGVSPCLSRRPIRFPLLTLVTAVCKTVRSAASSPAHSCLGRRAVSHTPGAVGITTHAHRPQSFLRTFSLRERRRGLIFLVHLRSHAQTSSPPFTTPHRQIPPMPLVLSWIYLILTCPQVVVT